MRCGDTFFGEIKVKGGPDDVSGNTFERNPNGVIFKLGGPDKIPVGYRVHDNVVRD